MGGVSPKTILIVDDNPAILSVVEYMLKQHNYQIILAQSGDDALEHFQQHPQISLVLLDIIMPDKSGIETLKSLKYKRPSTPISMITGYATERDINDAYTFGAADIVFKPFDKIDLLEKISSYI